MEGYEFSAENLRAAFPEVYEEIRAAAYAEGLAAGRGEPVKGKPQEQPQATAHDLEQAERDWNASPSLRAEFKGGGLPAYRAWLKYQHCVRIIARGEDNG